MRFTPSHFVVALVTVPIVNVRADTPQPLSVTFGSEYIGYDGQWSAAQIRVGTPEQYLQLFPSTISSETWVAGPKQCDGTSTCASLRGGIFYTENSTTWASLGAYELGYSSLTQTTENGDYGFDNISISDTISTSHQIVAVVDDLDHWNGLLGLNVQDTRFENTTNYLPFLSTLVQNNSAIPSHSYGYTAGASYQGKGVQGSLTLGGVDTSRYSPSNLSFTLGSGYMPNVAVKSILVRALSIPTNWDSNPLPLMGQDDAAIFTVDSSTPFLWLPRTVCDTIAAALNLTWDDSIELYRFANSSSPQSLTAWDLQFTFNLADSVSSSETIALKLSYGAFNLQLSYPFPGAFTTYSGAKIDYFPLRRANSTDQYTIGRAFLQETYLIVDYERNTFSLSQALFPDSSQQPLLNVITRPTDSTWPGPDESTSSAGLSTGAKIGIAVGIVVVVALFAALAIWFFCVRRRGDSNVRSDRKSPKTGFLSLFSRRSTRTPSDSASAAELRADKQFPTEIMSDSSNSRFELSAAEPVEMAAAEVPPNFFQERTHALIPQRNDPRTPVELVQPTLRSSIAKAGPYADHDARNQSPSPAPAYSPTDTYGQISSGISPNSVRNSHKAFQTNSDNGISPVTGTNSDRDRLSHIRHVRGHSGSSGLLSPVSPVQARGEEQNSSLSSIGAGSAGQVAPDNSLPRVNSHVPQRTFSRDSRFRENLEEASPSRPPDGSDLPAAVQGDVKSRNPRRSFSWD